MGAFLLVLAIIFNSIANGFFKAGSEIQDFTVRKGILIGLGLLIGLANTVCYIKALEKIELSVAYPLFSAASILLIAAISFLFFREGISFQKAAGLVTICIGLLVTWKS